MAEFSDKVLNRVVTVSFDGDGNFTHACQNRTVQVFKDGADYGKHTTVNENIEPADIAGVIPQADLLAQLTAAKAKEAADLKSIADALAAAEAAHAATRTDLQGQLAAALAAGEAVRVDLQGQLNTALAKLDAAQSHANALVAAIAPSA